MNILPRSFVVLLGASFCFKLALAALLTGFTLVDDAYITLRYAKNLIVTGEFVYNSGERVFGVTTPLYALVLSALYFVTESGVEVAIVVFNLLIWFGSTLLIYLTMAKHSFGLYQRAVTSILFCFFPSFVDNQLLGMETSLFVFLLLFCFYSVASDKLLFAASSLGLILITRPEGVLFIPVAVFYYWSMNGNARLLDVLLNLRVWLFVLFPVLSWIAFAYFYFGSPIPHSMIAKSGWLATSYDTGVNIERIMNVVLNLSVVPYIDVLSKNLKIFIFITYLGFLYFVVRVNFFRGNELSKSCLLFYFLYIAFYFFGKGAVEASWYSIPSTLMFMVAASPLFNITPKTIRKATLVALVTTLIPSSVFVAFKRSELTSFYTNNYHTIAINLRDYLSEKSGEKLSRVVIGEIGVFGYFSEQYIIDAAALISPQVLELRNSKTSFVKMLQTVDADFFVIGSGEASKNSLPGYTGFARDEKEQIWFEQNCKLLFSSQTKSIYQVI